MFIVLVVILVALIILLILFRIALALIGIVAVILLAMYDYSLFKTPKWHIIKKDNYCILESPERGNSYQIYAISKNSSDPKMYITGSAYTRSCLIYYNCNIPVLINHHYYQLKIKPVKDYKLNKILASQPFEITNLNYSEFVNLYKENNIIKIPVYSNNKGYSEFKSIIYSNFNKENTKFLKCIAND